MKGRCESRKAGAPEDRREKESARAPDSIDRAVGVVMRQLRVARGLSQKQVAEHLGLTIGQIQKYERSASRITASVLYRAADLFDVGVEAFYVGLRTPAPVSPFTPLFGRRREGVIVIPLTAGVAAAYVQEDELINVAVSYQQIRNPYLRAPIWQLVRRLAQETETE